VKGETLGGPEESGGRVLAGHTNGSAGSASCVASASKQESGQFTSPMRDARSPEVEGASASSSYTRMLWAAVALVVLYTILDGVAQVLPPHYSPISQAESDLAVGPYGYIMAINFLNRGVISLTFVYGFAGTLGQTPGGLGRYKGGLALLGVWGICAFLLAVFPTDVPSTPLSWHGAIHLAVALVAFVAGALGTLWISLRGSSDPALLGARTSVLPISVAGVISLLLLFGTLTGAIGGLIERVFIGSVLLWIVAMSIYLTRAANSKAGHLFRD